MPKRKPSEVAPRRSQRKRVQKSPEEEAEQYLNSDRDGLQEAYIDEIKGRGVKTTKSFEEGNFLLVYSGELIDESTAERRNDEYSADREGSFMFDFKHNGQKMCIDATIEDGRLARLVNDDNKDPNCIMKKYIVENRPTLCILARKDIAAGEELTYDYGITDLPWRVKNCAVEELVKDSREVSGTGEDCSKESGGEDYSQEESGGDSKEGSGGEDYSQEESDGYSQEGSGGEDYSQEESGGDSQEGSGGEDYSQEESGGDSEEGSGGEDYSRAESGGDSEEGSSGEEESAYGSGDSLFSDEVEVIIDNKGTQTEVTSSSGAEHLTKQKINEILLCSLQLQLQRSLSLERPNHKDCLDTLDRINNLHMEKEIFHNKCLMASLKKVAKCQFSKDIRVKAKAIFENLKTWYIAATKKSEDKTQEISAEEDNTQEIIEEEDNRQIITEEQDNRKTITEEEDNRLKNTEEEDTQATTGEDNTQEIIEEEDNRQIITEEQDNRKTITEEEDNRLKNTEEEDTQATTGEDNTQENTEKGLDNIHEISGEEDEAQEITEEDKSQANTEKEVNMHAITEEEDKVQEITEEEGNTHRFNGEKNNAQEIADEENTQEIKEEDINMLETKEEDNTQEITEKKDKDTQEIADEEDNTQEIKEEDINTLETKEEDNTRGIAEKTDKAKAQEIADEEDTQEISDENNRQEISDEDDMHEISDEDDTQEISDDEDATHEISDDEDDTQEISDKEDDTQEISDDEDDTQEIISDDEDDTQEISDNEDDTQEISDDEDDKQEISDKEDDTQEISDNEDDTQEISGDEDDTQEISDEEDDTQEITEEDDRAPVSVADDIAQELTEEEDKPQEVIRQKVKQQEVGEEAQAQDVTKKVEIPQVSDKDCKLQGSDQDLKSYTMIYDNTFVDSTDKNIPEVQAIASTINDMLHEIEGKPHTCRTDINTMEGSGDEGPHTFGKEITTVEDSGEESRPQESDVEGSVVENNEESKAQESEPAEIHIKCASKKKTEHGEKRVYDKRNACVYCGKLLQVVIGRHLLSQHADELAVAKINASPKGKHRTQQLDLLRHKGNYYHNDKVLKTGIGELILLRRPCDSYYNYDDYTPCPNCLGYVHVDNLWRHARYTCIAKNDHVDGDDTTKKTTIRMESEILKYKYSGVSDKLQRHVLASMQRGEVYNVLSSDPLILQYGNQILRKDVERKHLVSQKMRSAAKLVLKLRELDPSGTYISDFLKPSKFDLIVEAADYLSCPDADNDDEMKKPSVPIKLGHDLAWLARIKRGQAIRQEPPNERAEAEANRYLQLHTSEWGLKLASRATATLNSRKCEKVTELPKTQDLKKLSSHLISEVKLLGTTANNWQQYRMLQEATLARLILFNKRRPAEMAKIKVTSITHPPAIATIQEIEDQLSSLEKHLIDELKLVKIKGKKGRYVPVIIPKECQTALSTIIMKRGQYGILDDNKYVFARRRSMTRLDGGECIAKVVADMGDELESPEAIKTTRVRQYAATVSQVLALKENQMRWLADHLGHDVNVHTHFYRLQESHIELCKVSKLMLAMDRGEVGRWSGKSLDDIDVNDIPVQYDDADDVDVDPIPIKVPSGSVDESYEVDGSESCRPQSSHTTNNGETMSTVDTSCRPQTRNRTKNDESARCSKKASSHHSPLNREEEEEEEDWEPSAKRIKRSNPKRKKKGWLAWSTEEKKAVYTMFDSYIRRGLLPSREKCRLAQDKYPILHKREPDRIKDFVRNQITRLKTAKP
ncbi:uncharacterized protein [Amphiura filiformis]|uniref:uncharacterized protein isoform X2 n=1 Tax=Amphiura filiformis TaxID=82378 RepID=UPI003B21B9E6